MVASHQPDSPLHRLGDETQPAPTPTGADQLADALRRLVALAVTAGPAPPDLDAVLGILAEAGDRLAAGVRAERPPHLVEGASRLDQAMPYDLVIGTANPLAVPLRLTMVPPVAHAEGTFGPAYEGAPGCVHGGAIAAAFDIVLTAANWLAGPAGPTVDLQVRYRRPTLVGVPVRFAAEVDHASARRVISQARLTQDGQVTATATGRFAVLDPTQIQTLADRRRTDG